MSDNEELTTPLFRGATRPAMLFGIPTEALIKVISPLVLFIMAVWPFFGFYALFLFIPTLFIIMVMRDMTKRDDQYLNMFFMHIQEKAQLSKNLVGKIYVLPPRPIKKDSVNE